MTTLAMQLQHRILCYTAIALLCCARGVVSQGTDDIIVGGMPEGLLMDAEGGHYIMTDAGERWNVYRDKETMKIFFMHAETREPQWNDPREPLSVLEPEPLPVAAAATPMDTVRVATIATVPVVLLLAGLAGRIYYLHTHHPELLFPTKERKDRRRASGGKFKPQKARGKMNQDGKGGRSANS